VRRSRTRSRAPRSGATAARTRRESDAVSTPTSCSRSTPSPRSTCRRSSWRRARSRSTELSRLWLYSRSRVPPSSSAGASVRSQLAEMEERHELQLVHVFLATTPIHLDDAQAEDEPKLLWKAVLRTGTWKLRPGPGGEKLKAPLKIYRDKAPKGHISMSRARQELRGRRQGAGQGERHAPAGARRRHDVRRRLRAQAGHPGRPGEDGSKTKESLLWAGMEVTDSDLNKKLDEKSIVGVSGGILFDYERTEDAKKFDQILSHVMVTNSPWINGTGGFKDKLPEGVMAAEPTTCRWARSSSSRARRTLDPQLPVVQLDDPPAAEPPEPGKATNKVVWKPEQGFATSRRRSRRRSRSGAEQVMAAIPSEPALHTDWPYYRAQTSRSTASRAATHSSRPATARKPTRGWPGSSSTRTVRSRSSPS
jgi:hypothetical protein